MRHPGRATARRSYQVSIRGLLGPALRAVFRDLRAAQAPSTTVFRLRLEPGQGPADVINLLRRKQLVLVSLRAVPDEEPVPQPKHRPHLTRVPLTSATPPGTRHPTRHAARRPT